MNPVSEANIIFDNMMDSRKEHYIRFNSNTNVSFLESCILDINPNVKQNEFTGGNNQWMRTLLR